MIWHESPSATPKKTTASHHFLHKPITQMSLVSKAWIGLGTYLCQDLFPIELVISLFFLSSKFHFLFITLVNISVNFLPRYTNCVMIAVVFWDDFNIWCSFIVPQIEDICMIDMPTIYMGCFLDNLSNLLTKDRVFKKLIFVTFDCDCLSHDVGLLLMETSCNLLISSNAFCFG